jgi:hypothetical protein
MDVLSLLGMAPHVIVNGLFGAVEAHCANVISGRPKTTVKAESSMALQLHAFRG